MNQLAAVKPIDVPAPTKDDPHKRLKIGAKMRVAIDAIVFDGLDLSDAAAKANCTTRAIRKAFERSHVLAYLKRRREVFRASARGQNIRRLTQIRDAADNMPAVQAIRELERMDDADAIEAGARRSPGVVIIVQNGVAAHAPQAPNPVQVIDNVESEDR